MNDELSERWMRSSLALCLCGALAACGGGSEGDLADAAPPLPAPVKTVALNLPDVVMDRSRRSPTPTPAPALAPTPAPTSASCELSGTAGIQVEILQRVNAMRAAGAVCGGKTYAAAAPLNWNSMLLTAATVHASDMARNNFFSHTGSDGRTFDQRITAAGYLFSTAGENIAVGQNSVQRAVTTWINSPGHCQNLMNPAYRDVGVACVRNDAASYGQYWTMDLGRSR